MRYYIILRVIDYVNSRIAEGVYGNQKNIDSSSAMMIRYAANDRGVDAVIQTSIKDVYFEAFVDTELHIIFISEYTKTNNQFNYIEGDI